MKKIIAGIEDTRSPMMHYWDHIIVSDVEAFEPENLIFNLIFFIEVIVTIFER